MQIISPSTTIRKFNTVVIHYANIGVVEKKGVRSVAGTTGRATRFSRTAPHNQRNKFYHGSERGGQIPPLVKSSTVSINCVDPCENPPNLFQQELI